MTRPSLRWHDKTGALSMISQLEHELACLVSTTYWAPTSLNVRQDFSWPDFWELVRFNGVAILAAKKLAPLGVPVPSNIADFVAHTSAHNALRRQWALKLLRVLNSSSIDVYFLKGFLLGELVYHDPCYKRMNDVDLLIAPSRVEAAVSLLLQNGFRFASEAFFGKNPIDFRLHHSPPLISEDNSTLIGLHWGIASPYAKRRPNTDIFTESQSLMIDDVPARRMSHENNLLHLCIHLPFFKIGLRELADVANLILYAGSFLDWNIVFERAQGWRCEDALYRVVSLAHRVIFCIDAPVQERLDAIAHRLGRSRYVADTNKRIADLTILLCSRSTYIGKIEKNFVLFKLAKRYEDRAFHLREQWRHFFFVPRDEQARLLATSEAALRPLSPLRASAALWFALSQDLGVFFLILISAKNVFSLLKQRICFWRRPEANAHLQSAKQLMELIE